MKYLYAVFIWAAFVVLVFSVALLELVQLPYRLVFWIANRKVER